MEIDVPLKTPIAEGDPSAADGGTAGTGSRGSGGLGGTSIDKACSRKPTERGEEPFKNSLGRRYFSFKPSSVSWSSPTSEGEPVMRSKAPVVLGKGMTSRMDSSPARNMTSRSKPKAMPPCGGAP
jgi:hypothetical protein